MAKLIKVKVFDTMKDHNIMVSGWYSFSSNPNLKYGLCNGSARVPNEERRVYNKKWMDPEITIPADDIHTIHVKVRHRDKDLIFEHDYIYWGEDISVAWLREGNLGSQTVNWFYTDDVWYYGGEKKTPVISSHQSKCGNIPASYGTNKPTSTTSSTGTVTSLKEQQGATSIKRPGATPIRRPGAGGSTVTKYANIDELIDSLCKQAKDLEDGFDSMPTIPTEMCKGCEGTYVRGVRASNPDLSRFVFPRNTSNYYIGNILLVNDNETFFGNSPISLRFDLTQRKPLDIIPSTVMEDFSMLENVPPTEKELTKARNKFLIEYKKWASKNSFQLPEVANPKYYTFESQDGINLGGTIKDISFDAGLFTSSKSVTVVEFKQILYSLSINDTYQKASDFLQNITVDELKQKCTINGKTYAPAIIETVHYGKSAYLCAVCEDKTDASFSIGEYIKSGKCGGSSSWKFQVIVNGGKDNLPNGSMNLESKDLQTIVDALTTPLKAEDIETAVPIEFEACYLSLDRFSPVRLDIKPYYKRYVDTVEFHIVDNNPGCSISSIVRWIEPKLDENNKVIYNFVEKKGLKGDSIIKMSPWALAIEVKIDILGAAEKHDFNFFIPNIPLHLLRVNEDGICTMKCRITGTTLYNSKNVTIDPMPTGCHISESNQIFGVAGICSNYETQENILREFFRWCDYQAANDSSFSALGKERVDKSGKSRL